VHCIVGTGLIIITFIKQFILFFILDGYKYRHTITNIGTNKGWTTTSTNNWD